LLLLSCDPSPVDLLSDCRSWFTSPKSRELVSHCDCSCVLFQQKATTPASQFPFRGSYVKNLSPLLIFPFRWYLCFMPTSLTPPTPAAPFVFWYKGFSRCLGPPRFWTEPLFQVPMSLPFRNQLDLTSPLPISSLVVTPD